MSTTAAAALATVLAITIGWFGPAIDDHSAERAQAADIEAAQKQAGAAQRFERAAQRICGPQAAWDLLPDGSVQCRTKHGAKTITAQVAP